MGACIMRSIRPDNDDTKNWGPESFGFIVWKADGIKASRSPYFVARVGADTETFDQIPRGNGRRSDPVRDRQSPEWKSGFILDLTGISKPKLHVYIADADWFKIDQNIGFVSAPVSTLNKESLDGPVTLELKNTTGGKIMVSVGPPDILSKHDIDEFANFPKVHPVGRVRMCPAKAVTAQFPLTLGVAPLPPQLRGVFWLTKQRRYSALMSFGGPSNDGGGCSTGRVQGNRYAVRVDGDRVWADAKASIGDDMNAQYNDVIYNFIFDDGEDPKHAQIYAQFKSGRGMILKNDWFLDYEMKLRTDDERYPNSVVWMRYSYMFGVGPHRYKLVQIYDEHGQKLEPAFADFVKYQNGPGMPARGKIFYREIQNSE